MKLFLISRDVSAQIYSIELLAKNHRSQGSQLGREIKPVEALAGSNYSHTAR